MSSSDWDNRRASGSTYHVRWSAIRAIFNGHDSKNTKRRGVSCAEESAQCDVFPYNNDVVSLQ